MKATLHLNLHKKWFEMIDSGEKKEEYRELTQHWAKFFTKRGDIKIKGRYYHPSDVIIQFSNGYQKGRREIFVQCTGLKVGEGNPSWGAEPGKIYYILKLGEKL